ncbi:VOC family protein [Arthrobacter sp. A5]
MNINRIQVLTLPVSDQERAKAFYVDAFRLEGDPG